MFDKHTLVQQLHNGVVSVVFTKADGSTRTMKCTLQDEYLPEQVLLLEGEEAKPKRVMPESLVTVWDVEANGWRSFHIDSVQSVGA